MSVQGSVGLHVRHVDTKLAVTDVLQVSSIASFTQLANFQTTTMITSNTTLSGNVFLRQDLFVHSLTSLTNIVTTNVDCFVKGTVTTVSGGVQGGNIQTYFTGTRANAAFATNSATITAWTTNPTITDNAVIIGSIKGPPNGTLSHVIATGGSFTFMLLGTSNGVTSVSYHVARK